MKKIEIDKNDDLKDSCFTQSSSKWILIEVENQNISEPSTYNSYIEAYNEMRSRYENLVNNVDGAFVGTDYISIQMGSYSIDWKIYEVKTE